VAHGIGGNAQTALRGHALQQRIGQTRDQLKAVLAAALEGKA
jgi:hypothetical protein